METERSYENKGPFIKKGGIVSDREIWENDMSPEGEKKFDDYMFIKAVNIAAKKEIARRNLKKTYESLMEGLIYP